MNKNVKIHLINLDFVLKFILYQTSYLLFIDFSRFKSTASRRKCNEITIREKLHLLHTRDYTQILRKISRSNSEALNIASTKGINDTLLKFLIWFIIA